ncbi:MAG: thioredoxin family protein [Bacteroidota bacterium]|nr:thioredoxin family protein [Bacteroidota bacterium]
MRRLIFLLFVFLFVADIGYAQRFPTIKIGDECPSPSLQMTSVDNRSYQLDDHFKQNGLLIVFTSNTCPFVVAWEDRYKLVETICKENGIDMLYINSNHKKRLDDDSFEAMQAHAKSMDYQFPYLLDEKSQLANAFGAKTTPHIFLFNAQKKLVYMGAIDDNYTSAREVTEFYLKDAIESLVFSKPIQNAETKAVGCSIKRHIP